MSVQTNAEVHVTPSPALADAATEAAHASHQRKARPALRLVKTTEISRDDWLNVRRRGIGSSDAAAAVGLNPYQSRLALWMEKTGRDLCPADDFNDPLDDTQPMYWGSLLEPIVAAHYTRRTGLKVRRINAVLQHPEHPWMLANIDREVMGSADVQLLECKTAGIHGAKLWRDGVPEYVQLQVLHQLAVTGKQACDLAVLIGGQELRIHRIERDEAAIAHLIELEAAFWHQVALDQAPPGDGSDSAEAALRALYPSHREQLIDWSQDTAMSRCFADLQAIRQRAEVLATEEGVLAQRIKQAMGDAGRALFETGEVTYRQAKDSVVLDTKRLLREQPQLLETHGVTRMGSRRFLLRETAKPSTDAIATDRPSSSSISSTLSTPSIASTSSIPLNPLNPPQSGAPTC